MTMKRLSRAIGILISLSGAFLFCGCAAIEKQAPQAQMMQITDISEGLPKDGLWRQNLVLADMNGDGSLDIVTPPPRKARPEERRPFIFIQDMGGKWHKGDYAFPDLKDYNYGSVAVGDINGDGYPDIALAAHEGRIILLLNNREGGFVEASFPQIEGFHSRTIALSDINGDGKLDIISPAELPTVKEQVPTRGISSPQQAPEGKGILLGINRGDGAWDAKIIEGTPGSTFSDSLAVADINGDGNKDILIAPLVAMKGFSKDKTLWLGDGRGNFRSRTIQGLSDWGVDAVAAGDVDGDGADEAILLVYGFGPQGKMMLKALTWANGEERDISSGLEILTEPRVFDLADIDGDGRKELLVLWSKGLSILKYRDGLWSEIVQRPLSRAEMFGAYALKASRQKDGSVLIVYNLGSENPDFNRGIRAYLLK